MIDMNDDILNKYIDEELDTELMQQVKTKLESSPKDMLKYKALLSVHHELKRMSIEEVSEDFTPKLMMKVGRNLKSKREQNFFIASVLTLFFLICIGIIGYLLAGFIFTAHPGSSDVAIQFTSHSENLITLLRNTFSKVNISIIGSIFSFILIISGYFFFEKLKHSKN